MGGVISVLRIFSKRACTMGKWTVTYMLVHLLKFVLVCLRELLLNFVPRALKAKSLKGQVALVTGAGSGIGRLTALDLSREGCHVICWDINKQGNDETAMLIRKMNGKADAFVVDVTDKREVYKAAREVKGVIGTKEVTLLINNAGIVIGKYLEEADDDKIEMLMKVNVMAHFWTTKAFMPGMVKRKCGHIVTVASTAGYVAAVDKMVPYFTSKFAAVGFDEALSVELDFQKRNYIKTTSINPYFILTGMFEGVTTIPVLPFLKPDEVAHEIVQAIRCNERCLILPGRIRFLIFLKSFIPRNAMLELGRAFGMDSAMDSFKGRDKSA